MAPEFNAEVLTLLDWAIAHPCVLDLDTAAERLLYALDGLTPGASIWDLGSLADLLNELVDTVGNCQTEEQHLKSEIWTQIVTRAGIIRSGQVC